MLRAPAALAFTLTLAVQLAHLPAVRAAPPWLAFDWALVARCDPPADPKLRPAHQWGRAKRQRPCFPAAFAQTFAEHTAMLARHRAALERHWRIILPTLRPSAILGLAHLRSRASLPVLRQLLLARLLDHRSSATDQVHPLLTPGFRPVFLLVVAIEQISGQPIGQALALDAAQRRQLAVSRQRAGDAPEAFASCCCIALALPSPGRRGGIERAVRHSAGCSAQQASGRRAGRCLSMTGAGTLERSTGGTRCVGVGRYALARGIAITAKGAVAAPPI
jgi:hypothetical protein